MRLSLQILLSAATALSAVEAFAPTTSFSARRQQSAASFASIIPAQSTSPTTATTLSAELTLYGSQGSRSPLVNWAAYELGLDFDMASDLSSNPHPFGQIPCLVSKTGDGKEEVVFESGAILLYLDQLAEKNSPKEKGEIFSWVQWANASLDPICFLETPQGKVYDTGLKDTQNKKIHRLNDILGKQQFLVV